jgi:kynurenine formamidase
LVKDGVNLSDIEMGAHTGTHVDAPIHFIEGGAGVGELPVEQYVGEAVVLDLSYKPSGSAITENDLKRFKKLIKKGDIVLLYTGMSTHWNEKWASTNYTYIGENAAKWLVDKGVKTVGIDFLSVEKYGVEEPKTHRILLGSGVTIIESLSSELKRFVGERIFLVCLPLKIEGSDGAPARAIAYTFE